MVISILPRTMAVHYSKDEISPDTIKMIIANNATILSTKQIGNDICINVAGSCEELYNVIYDITAVAIGIEINIY